MKIEKLSKTDYFIYLYEINNQEIETIKNILKKLPKRININGYYRAQIIKKKIGVFLKLIRLEDSYYDNTLDFRFINRDENIYFKTKNIDLLTYFEKVIYYNTYYYGLLDNELDNSKIMNIIEFGSFVLENANLLKKGIRI